MPHLVKKISTTNLAHDYSAANMISFLLTRCIAVSCHRKVNEFSQKRVKVNIMYSIMSCAESDFCNFAADTPTLRQITLLKWKDVASGGVQRLRICQEISSQWEKLGTILGFSNNFLQAIDRQYSSKVEQCCHQVFCSWLEDGEIEAPYARSWEGICELLDDMEYCDISTVLTNLLTRD